MNMLSRMEHRSRQVLPAIAAIAMLVMMSSMIPARARAETAAGGHAAAHATPAISPDHALAQLMAGNARFVAHAPTHPNQDAARMHELAEGQHPVAVVLCCADSRVGPEMVFDQGLGDLFVVRVAGNIADPATIGSIEYAVENWAPR